MFILICEDDIAFQAQIEEWLLHFFDREEPEIKKIASLEELASLLQPPPNLLFLDIRLPDGNALEAMKHWRDKCSSMDIIYMTNQSADVADIANTNPFGFLAKNQLTEDIQTSFFELMHRWFIRYQSDRTFVYKVSGTAYIFRYSDIVCFVKHKRQITPHTIYGEQPAFYCAMDALTAELDDRQFMSIGHSIIINHQHIVVIRRDEVQLTNGMVFPISQGYQKKVQAHIALIFRKEGPADDRF